MAMFFAMLVVFVAMLVTLAAAGLVVAYVAFVQQGKEIPRAGWLTDAMRRLVDRWSVPTEPAEYDDPGHQLHVQGGGIRRPSER
ncbi:MAG TPA: hypothetical protein VHG70_00095 [Nocardioidaceae bacterium]|nr:hypothetical protein [Nocardioidaceae bacterium]